MENFTEQESEVVSAGMGRDLMPTCLLLLYSNNSLTTKPKEGLMFIIDLSVEK